MGERIGRYELVRPVGEGGSATVWEALLHGPLGFCKPVALKIVDNDAPGDRFLEARLGSQLQHPNVVATFAVEELDGRCCIAMELVRGTSARSLIDQGPISDRAAVELGLQTLDALDHIHAHRLVHRDIKPANLLVTEGGQVKVTDLGIARPIGSAQNVSGTYGYIPPEQCEGRATPASDVFAVGVTLHRMLTCKPLFGRGAMSLVHTAAADKYLANSRGLDAIAHEGLRAFVARCVRQDPADRPSSAAQARDELAALVVPGLTGASLRETMAERFTEATEELPTAITLPGEAVYGRGALLLELADRLESHRWITLHGEAGVGKSTVARALGDALERPFVLVDADGVDSVEALAGAAGRALGVNVPSSDSPLAGVLAGATGVVVLDHVDDVPGWDEAVLAALPHTEAAVVTVSIGVLHAERPEELRVVVPPLAPEAAAELYQARRGIGTVDPELLAGFDGNPLAIELAAARHEHSVREPTRSSRRGSLAASLAATWRLLPSWGAGALARLASFENGFTVLSAAAVLDPAGPEPLEVLDTLHRSGLLRYDRATERFRLPRHVRSHAAEVDGEEAALGRLLHGDWFAQLGVRSTLLALHEAENVELRERVASELVDLVAAVRRAEASGRAEVAHAAALAAAWVYRTKGPTSAALDILRFVEGQDSPRLDEVLLRSSFFALSQGDLRESARLAARSRELARKQGKAAIEVQAELRLAQIMLRNREHDDAREVLYRALARATEARISEDQAYTLFLISSLEMRVGDLERALSTALDCAVLFEACRYVGATITALTNAGLMRTSLGDDEGALEVLEEALAHAMDLGDDRKRAGVSVWIAEVRARADDVAGAREALDGIRVVLEALADPLLDARVGVVRGVLARMSGPPAEAAERLTAAVETLTAVEVEEAHVARIELAEALLAAGRPDDALHEVQTALKALFGKRWLREVAHLLALRARARHDPEDVARARKVLRGQRAHPR
ncbi:MAG: protein kinase, partial [Myxococcales bacterium]|nr:protein kinase [Myxococcales bacterium]